MWYISIYIYTHWHIKSYIYIDVWLSIKYRDTCSIYTVIHTMIKSRLCWDGLKQQQKLIIYRDVFDVRPWFHWLRFVWVKNVGMGQNIFIHWPGIHWPGIFVYVCVPRLQYQSFGHHISRTWMNLRSYPLVMSPLAVEKKTHLFPENLCWWILTLWFLKKTLWC